LTPSQGGREENPKRFLVCEVGVVHRVPGVQGERGGTGKESIPTAREGGISAAKRKRRGAPERLGQIGPEPAKTGKAVLGGKKKKGTRRKGGVSASERKEIHASRQDTNAPAKR